MFVLLPLWRRRNNGWLFDSQRLNRSFIQFTGLAFPRDQNRQRPKRLTKSLLRVTYVSGLFLNRICRIYDVLLMIDGEDLSPVHLHVH